MPTETVKSSITDPDNYPKMVTTVKRKNYF